MSMGPYYENVNCRDFGLYFNGCAVYKHDYGTGTGAVYDLGTRIGPTHDDLAAQIEHHLARLSTTSDDETFPHEMFVRGAELMVSPLYRLHRVPLEYLPLGPNQFIRVSAEPFDRRASKGTQFELARIIPALSIQSPEGRVNDLIAAHVLGRSLSRRALADGMVAVMSIGLPKCMRDLIPLNEATARAKEMVRNLLRWKKRRVCVPDFSMVLIRNPSDTSPSTAEVLYHGVHVGTVSYDESNQLVFIGKELVGERASPQAEDLYRQGVEQATLLRCADKVRW